MVLYQKDWELPNSRIHFQEKCQQARYINQIKFLSLSYNKRIINWAKMVCMGESRLRLWVQTSTSVKILPYRPPAWLIRAKYQQDQHALNKADLLYKWCCLISQPYSLKKTSSKQSKHCNFHPKVTTLWGKWQCTYTMMNKAVGFILNLRVNTVILLLLAWWQR